LTAKFSIFAHVFYFCPKTKYKKKWETLFGNPTFKILYRTVVFQNKLYAKNETL